jgi:L-malate glycosyltransferase
MTVAVSPLDTDRSIRPAASHGPLRVCHIMTADLWAGAEAQLATTASYLVERPDILLTAVLFNDGWLANELRRLGIETIVVDEHAHSAPQIVVRVARFLRERQIDVVHTHRYKDTVLGTIAAKRAGVPCIVRTVHGLSEQLSGWNRVKFVAYDALDTAALWCCADRVIAVSDQMATALRQTRHRFGTVIHIANGINLRQIVASRPTDDVRRMLGVRSDGVLIGTAGRLAAVKGHEYLLRAAPLVLEHEPRARFVLVGDGPCRERLMSIAATLNVDRACLFVDPSVDLRAGVYDLMAAMDIFVLPSLSEGIPMALLEAMALRRPAIATSVGGVPEVIADRATGLLVEPRNERVLAAACIELAANPAWAKTLGSRARRSVEARFSHDRNGQALVELYRDIVGARRSRMRRVGTMTLASAPLRALARRVRSRTECALERRRMRRLGRAPRSAGQMLRSARSILVVCHGNIIRSPYAARLLSSAMNARRPISVASAGLEAEPGRPSHPTAIQIAAALGVDLSAHAAARISPEAVARADAIFVMDVPQLVAVKRRFPAARNKTLLLSCLASDAPLEIRDPVDAPPDGFRACYTDIARAIQPLARVLTEPIE